MPALHLATIMAPMAVADLDRVLAIESGAYSHPWNRGHFIDSLAGGHDARVLILDDAGIVGYSVCSEGVDEWHVLNLTVARGHWRQGLGSRLLLATIEAARSRAKSAVWLEVRAGNQPALALYRRHGFETSGIRRGYYPDRAGREDAVLMTLPLPPVQDGRP